MLLVIGIGIVSQDEEIHINLPASVAMVGITLALHATWFWNRFAGGTRKIRSYLEERPV